MNKPLPTTTAIQSRVPVFAASTRASRPIDYRFENQWGKIEISGHLTQTHRSILDILLTCYPQHKMADESVAILFPLYDMLQRLGQGNGGGNRDWLVSKLRELMAATVTLTSTTNGIECGIETGIIREHRWVRQPGQQPLYGVVLSPTYIAMVERGIAVRYTEEQLALILSLPASAQALARFALSHRNLNMRLEDILSALGVTGISDRAVRKTVSTILSVRDELLQLGIAINGETRAAIVRRSREPEVEEPKYRHRGTKIPLVRNQNTATPEPKYR